MISIIDKHIDVVNQGLNWVSSNLSGSRRDDAYQHLVNSRRELKKIKSAIQIEEQCRRI